MTVRAQGPFSLRNARAADVPKIALIHREARQAAMPWLPVLHTPAEDLWFFTNRVLPDQQVTVACSGGEVIGFAACHEAWLNHLYIAPAHWRQGAGAILLGHAQSSNQALDLWTFAQNLEAQAFYARAGFEIVARTDGAHNEERTPDVQMRWVRSV